ncbi:nudix (nucleoside diphosphate linked moiety X)-type motif 17 [Seminavis robusta]|uniref:Nudix (Nucleoside diphosphate linked moiety X)-type motif 17 n=1 Tax=Seminavis robusta TaxID=568900 RepID=A0A9N8DDC2_9STRA|nr:nudix (nucleoside diphosphate linked moiety X)-type motif 17 [Seminavis robusta]|eukprot:Sro90_g047270.1 nudix (nucleoside diphosphate linked moiety X)-type motif 17 (371) ;mRNA; f:25676-26788
MLSRVWIRAVAEANHVEPCIFGKSMFDSLRDSLVVAEGEESTPGASTKHYDRQMVSFWEDLEDSYRVILERPGSSSHQHPSSSTIPMGRARPFPSLGATACPTTVKPLIKNSKKPHPALAVVGLILDPTGQYILLTRRPSYMRVFPGAWVLPGGGFDAGTDFSLEDALRREVLEETGLTIHQTSIPVCIWESVYPTDPNHPDPIKAHHLVVFLQGFASSRTTINPQSPPLSLTLQATEVETALWLSVADFKMVRQKMKNTKDDRDKPLPAVPVIHAKETKDTTTTKTELMSLDTLVGIYPQPDTTCDGNTEQLQQHFCGIAQGSLFALEELLLQRNRNKDGFFEEGQSSVVWSRPVASTKDFGPTGKSSL